MLHVVYHHAENPTEVGLLVHASVSYKSSNRKSYFVEPCELVEMTGASIWVFFFYWILFRTIFLTTVLLIKSHNNNHDFVIIW